MTLVNQKTLLLAFTFLMSYPALAGRDGGGGGALVCPAGHPENVIVDGREYQVQLLDLWEGQKSQGLFAGLGEIRRTNQFSVLEQLEDAVSRLEAHNPEFGELVRLEGPHRDEMRNKPGQALYIQNAEDVSTKGSYVLPPPDTNRRTLPIGCQIKGLAVYSDVESDLSYDGSLLNQMPSTDQAAFWLHERIYRVLRNYEKSTDSLQTRLIVARLFTSRDISWANDNAPDSILSMVCTTKTEEDSTPLIYKTDGRFFIETDGKGVVRLSLENRISFNNKAFGYVAILNTFYAPFDIQTLGPNGSFEINPYAVDLKKIVIDRQPVAKRSPSDCFMQYGKNTGSAYSGPMECAGAEGWSGSIGMISQVRNGEMVPYVMIKDNRILLPTKDPKVFKFNGHVGFFLNGIDIDKDSKYNEPFYCRERVQVTQKTRIHPTDAPITEKSLIHKGY